MGNGGYLSYCDRCERLNQVEMAALNARINREMAEREMSQSPDNYRGVQAIGEHVINEIRGLIGTRTQKEIREDAPPRLPNSEWRRGETGWNLWAQIESTPGQDRYRYTGTLDYDAWQKLKDSHPLACSDEGAEGTLSRPPALQESAPIQSMKMPDRSDAPRSDLGVSVDAGNVVDFPVKKLQRGRKKKDADTSIRVETVKPSKGTWAFRLRWTEADGSRPTVYVSRVDDKRYQMITKRKVTYEQFKKALIASYRMSRSVRAGQTTGGSASGSL
jgi:hypothetical protein